jgi:hypothetical protein
VIEAIETIPQVKPVASNRLLNQAVTRAVEMFCEDLEKARKEGKEHEAKIEKLAARQCAGMKSGSMMFSDGHFGLGTALVASDVKPPEKKKAKGKGKSIKALNKLADQQRKKIGERLRSGLEFTNQFFIHELDGVSERSGCNERWSLYAIESWGYDFLLEFAIAASDEKLKLLQARCSAKVWKRFYDLVYVVNLDALVGPRASPYGLRFGTTDYSRNRQKGGSDLVLFDDGMKIVCHHFFRQASLVDQAKIFESQTRNPAIAAAISGSPSYQDLVVEAALDEASRFIV